MTRKERPKIILQTNTNDILYSLANYPEASKILLSSGEKEYSSFLECLLKNFFFRNIENTSVKYISEATNTKRDKATKWIKQIYDDIFLLNDHCCYIVF